MEGGGVTGEETAVGPPRGLWEGIRTGLAPLGRGGQEKGRDSGEERAVDSHCQLLEGGKQEEGSNSTAKGHQKGQGRWDGLSR